MISITSSDLCAWKEVSSLLKEQRDSFAEDEQVFIQLYLLMYDESEEAILLSHSDVTGRPGQTQRETQDNFFKSMNEYGGDLIVSLLEDLHIIHGDITHLTLLLHVSTFEDGQRIAEDIGYSVEEAMEEHYNEGPSEMLYHIQEDFNGMLWMSFRKNTEKCIVTKRNL